MRESVRWALLWQSLALGCYLAGVVLFVLGAVEPFLAPPTRSLATLTTGHVALIVASLASFVAGGLASWKGGWRSTLPATSPWGSQLGRSDHRTVDRGTDRNPTTAYEDGEVYLRCPECGAKNETDYTYCRECSSELPRL